MTYISTNSGFIRWIILIILLVLILSYFGFDIRGLLEDEQTQDNLKAVFSFFARVWTDYLQGPVQYVGEEIIVGFIWEDVIQPLLQNENAEIIPEEKPPIPSA